jgi:hypothetical protein
MIDRVFVGLFFGILIGSAFTVATIAFLMGARPDTPQKRMEDAEGLRIYIAKKGGRNIE